MIQAVQDHLIELIRTNVAKTDQIQGSRCHELKISVVFESVAGMGTYSRARSETCRVRKNLLSTENSLLSCFENGLPVVGETVYSLYEGTGQQSGNQLRIGPPIGTRGTVTGPAEDGDKTRLVVVFEDGAGGWNLLPTAITRTEPQCHMCRDQKFRRI